MTKKIECKDCKFVDRRALKAWSEGKQIPYCTYPGIRELDKDGGCQSGRMLERRVR